ncbi:phosphatase 2C-like domain-containing protein [Aspergillus novoparasiticus]|uniref:Phosphatase 2C-like domain-containing protein n=1 Tax=Aspergillus novoparasiticus TaxID=986946 RepID=A0A5N6EBB9_9EURO|nr:phosphatase 2C-like domain-containing protein [Aspergillus novoparasiticus]
MVLSSLQEFTRADVIKQLQIRVKATQGRLEEVEAALNRCREYSAQDIEIISRQRVRILNLEDLVQKQKTTISNQSKAIADPKRIRIWQSTIPMPIFTLTPTQQRPIVRSPSSSTPSSASPYSPSVDTLPPPAFGLPASTPQGKLPSLEENSKTSLSRKRGSFPMSICSLGSSFDTETVIRVISTRLQRLFSRTQKFGHMYTNFPSIQFDSQLNPRVKEYVMSISNKIHASTLLGNPCTRLCVVAKAINFYLVHEILQPTVVKGFDAQMDMEINQIQEHLTIVQVRTLADRRISLILPKRCYTSNPANAVTNDNRATKRPEFHDYFVTHLPSSSLHPDPRAPVNSFYKLPRSASVPHTGESSHPPASFQPLVDRETTVVRIPLRSAKHHFGASTSRGTRPENEDTYQAGVIDIPAFAKRPPASLTIKRSGANGFPAPRESQGAETASGDPQVFYFAVFDGHGGNECSTFLQHTLHEYIQDSAATFELQSSLKKNRDGHYPKDTEPSTGDLPILQDANSQRIGELEKHLVRDWRTLVGGYFKRFVPPHFSHIGRGARGEPKALSDLPEGVTIEEVLEYAFLRTDLEFVSAQAAKQGDELENVGHPLYQDNILYGRDRTPSLHIGGVRRFKGGSTASIALISTPTPTPFWHPSSPSSLLVSHVGDTRILLCSTETGDAIPLTSNHHPSSPIEASRLRRYATTFVTDSFGEERMSGLANTRAFGDVQSKRIGVSAEPELRRIEMAPAEYSFLVLMSDGISGTLSDQEVVDIVKEARTPEQGSRDVVNFANEVTKEGDNATCLVVRLGGWERRLEGGLGSMGTKESREWRRQEATDPRRSRR